MRLRFLLLLLPAAACGRSSGTPAVDARAASTQSATAAAANSPDAAITAVVYKDANCGCCAKWVDHLRSAGFNVVAHDVTDLAPVKRRHSIPRSLHSCHTAEIGDYVVEGHVPADLIRKMLRERPNIAGIAVPGMPMGSPGMEGAYSERYEIVAFTGAGRTSVYASR